MLDIGGWEFMLVAFVLIIVVGPKELPKMLRGFTRIMTQVRSMAREFTDGMNDLARDADMADIKEAMEDVRKGNMAEIAAKLEATETNDGVFSGVAETLNETSQDLKQAANEAGATGSELAADARQSAEAEAAAGSKKAAAKPAKKAASKKAATKQAATKQAATKKMSANGASAKKTAAKPAKKAAAPKKSKTKGA